MERRFPLIPISIIIFAIFFSTHSNLSNAVTCPFTSCFRISSRSRFIKIIYNINILILATITSFARPIIKDIITNINIFILLCSMTWAKTRYTALAMRYHIMMIRSMISTPVSTISMRTFSVSRIM